MRVDARNGVTDFGSGITSRNDELVAALVPWVSTVVRGAPAAGSEPGHGPRPGSLPAAGTLGWPTEAQLPDELQFAYFRSNSATTLGASASRGTNGRHRWARRGGSSPAGRGRSAMPGAGEEQSGRFRPSRSATGREAGRPRCGCRQGEGWAAG